MVIEPEKWERCVKINKDSYGKACVDVARRVMEILDEEPGDFDPHKIVCRADEEVKAGGITGFMAGCVANMVSSFHSRGEEFRKKWNLFHQVGTEGERANEKGGVINPALMSIDLPE